MYEIGWIFVIICIFRIGSDHSSKENFTSGGGSVVIVEKAENSAPVSAIAKIPGNYPLSAMTRSPLVNINPDNTCPAVKAPASNTFVAYNLNFQAATLDEVVSFFLDPIIDDPRQARTITNDTPDNAKLSRGADNIRLCLSKECLGCVQALADILKEEILDDPHFFNSISKNSSARNNASIMANFLGLSSGKGDLRKFCKRLPYVRPADFDNFVPMDLSKSELDKVVQKLKGNSGSKGHRRNRRKADKKDKDKPGISTPLDCRYRRGDQTNDTSNTVGLCNLCWSLRTLPGNYFPRFVNELSCDSSDNSCLSAFGECRERWRPVTVLYNYGSDDNPRWQDYNINTAVGCECRVQVGSALHNLVSH